MTIYEHFILLRFNVVKGSFVYNERTVIISKFSVFIPENIKRDQDWYLILVLMKFRETYTVNFSDVL